MTRFIYRAVKFDGEEVEGEYDAVDEAALIRQLQAEGLIPLKTRPAGGLRARFTIRQHHHDLTAKEIESLTRQLATLLQSGLTLDRSLQILSELSSTNRLAKVLLELQDRVRGGSTFAAALAARDGQFPKLYINMVRAGEMSGALDEVLSRLADYLERNGELRATVVSALIYPAILLVIALLSVILLLVFVVPQFTVLFDDMGAALPFLTRIVVGTGELFRHYWWALLVIIAIIAVWAERWLLQSENRRRFDYRLMTLPLIGDLIWKMETARFCHTLSTLLKNGLPLLNGLGLAKEVVGNQKIVDGLTTASDELRHGRGIAGPLAHHGVLPQLALQMLRVGEESGTLDTMLMKVADIFDRETRSSVQRLLTLLEPVLIIGLGMIVAGIIISILMAILGANELVF
jgi:general secretion pathway protein F